jgi:hypothetical protein
MSTKHPRTKHPLQLINKIVQYLAGTAQHTEIRKVFPEKPHLELEFGYLKLGTGGSHL